MSPDNPNDFTTILQASISPVALISGVGLLLLSLTNRFGRMADRARDLCAQIAAASGPEADNLDVQIRILYRRATILRASISLAATSILLSCLLVAEIFISGLVGFSMRGYAIALFGTGFVTLVASLVLFIKDMGLSLKALRLELGPHVGHSAPPARREQTGFISRTEQPTPQPAVTQPANRC